MVFVWKQNYILVDEYFFFCCTWIVNSADITEVSRGIDCNCICPACKTDLLAKQGEVKLWHFSHSTAVAGDCDGLMEAIRGKIIEVINEHQVLGFPNLLAGDDGGPVSLNEVSGSGSMFGGTADLFEPPRVSWRVFYL
ncbi:competence protein CoiA family protein [Klebsiella pneumoniae]